jgi:rod shape determining protein RodA
MSVFTVPAPRDVRSKLYEINWTFVLLIALIGAIGVAMLYSVESGSWDPYAIRHLVRLSAGLGLMIVVAMFPPRFWMGIAYPAYLGALILLIGVEVMGVTAGGAQRWIDIGPIRMQPSEIMKIALVLALARYYHDLPEERVSGLGGLMIPAVMIGLPMALILMQPDLGTSLLLAATGAAIIFMAGLSWWVILGGAIFAIAGALLYLNFFIEPYQLARITTFLNPEEDPMGAGYQILQSQIALGSGGATGKGFMQGTQASLDFLPEKQTDFIFTMLGEEFGFVGGVVVLGLYALLLANCVLIASSCKSTFLRLMVMGVATTFSLYVFINVGMVMGLLPVVGVPLPLISYGGTVMLAVLFGLGLILGAHVHRSAEPPKGAGLFG